MSQLRSAKGFSARASASMESTSEAIRPMTRGHEHLDVRAPVAGPARAAYRRRAGGRRRRSPRWCPRRSSSWAEPTSSAPAGRAGVRRHSGGPIGPGPWTLATSTPGGVGLHHDLYLHRVPPQVRLRLRPGRPHPAGPAGWQGRQPGRDDAHGAAGPARLHDHHGGLPLLPRARPRPRGAAVADRPPRAAPRGGDGAQARRPRVPAARVRAVGCPVLDARDDGDGPQHRPQRRQRHGPRPRTPTTTTSRGTPTAG